MYMDNQKYTIINNTEKDTLKEYCEKNRLSYHAPYTESGKNDHRTFSVEVYVAGESRGVGKGQTIRAAENEACHLALQSLKVD